MKNILDVSQKTFTGFDDLKIMKKKYNLKLLLILKMDIMLVKEKEIFQILCYL